jgi:hypothetical protein
MDHNLSISDVYLLVEKINKLLRGELNYDVAASIFSFSYFLMSVIEICV